MQVSQMFIPVFIKHSKKLHFKNITVDIILTVSKFWQSVKLTFLKFRIFALKH